MCGILGIVCAQDRSLQLTRAQVLQMRETMSARGPDGAGLVQMGPEAVFAHRRLAIRDEAHGQQPWTSEDGRYVLTFNGEIYNTAELQEWTAPYFSAPPRTHCDTELLMRAFQVWGAGCANKLRGMFAFGVYDTQRQQLTLVRDRFGIKPLYYAECAGEFVFASSLSALLKHPHCSRRPNECTMTHYLVTLRPTLGEQTLYEQILQLRPGCVLTYDRRSIQISQYWDYPGPQEWTDSLEESQLRLSQTLSEAVKLRLVSDVPVGMMLSGGVDSNLLATYIRELAGSDFVAECGVGGNSQQSEESEYARGVAELLGCHFQTIEVDQQTYRTSWETLIEETSQPLTTPSDVIIAHLARSLKKQIGVVLGGEGADELFCGYPAMHGIGRDYDLSRSLDSTTAPLSTSWNAAARETFVASFQRTYRCSLSASHLEMYWALGSLIPFSALPLLFPAGVSQIEHIQEYYQQILQESVASEPDTAGWRGMKKVLHRVNLEALLQRLDQATMAASLEARVPYTDHRLVEQFWNQPQSLAWTLPAESSPWFSATELDQQGRLQSKRLLRALAQQRLPARFAQRRKASFPTPVPIWLTQEWREWAQQKILKSPFLKNSFAQQPLTELAQNPEAASLWLWPLLNLALWGDQN